MNTIIYASKYIIASIVNSFATYIYIYIYIGHRHTHYTEYKLHSQGRFIKKNDHPSPEGISARGQDSLT